MPIRTLLISLLLVAVAGCSTLEHDPLYGLDASDIYTLAKEARGRAEYDKALELFSKLEARYPYGRYAQQAQIETIYTHYKNEQEAAAVAASERFIKLYPRHPNVDYAYYMRGLATSTPPRNLLSMLFPRDPSERSPQNMRRAFQHYSELNERFPTSKYSADAHPRMVKLRDDLARYEINVATYYLTRGAYLAAAKRGEYLLETYPGSPAEAEGLAIMVTAYRKLNLDKLANDALRVLRLNYPESPLLSPLEKELAQGASKG